MSKYYVLTRIETAHIAGKGANRGEVISIRLATEKVTNYEKKRAVILEVEMTKTQMLVMQKAVRPRAYYTPLTQPPDPETNPDGYLTWELACKEEQDKLVNWGLSVDFDAVPEIKAKLANIDNLKIIVEPIVVAQTVITEVQAEKL